MYCSGIGVIVVAYVKITYHTFCSMVSQPSITICTTRAKILQNQNLTKIIKIKICINMFSKYFTRYTFQVSLTYCTAVQVGIFVRNVIAALHS